MFKKYFLLFLSTLFIANPVLGGCLDAEEIELIQQKNRFIKREFLPGDGKEETLENKFETLVNHFWYDDEVAVSFSMFLLEKGNVLKGLHGLVRPILSGAATTSDIEIFMGVLKSLEIGGQSLKPYIERTNAIFTNPYEYAQNRGVKGNAKKVNKTLNDIFIDTAKDLFEKLYSSISLYEATLKIFMNTLSSNKNGVVMARLISELYDRGDFSGYLYERYAALHLIPKNHWEQWEEAKGIYKTLLGKDLDADNPYQTAEAFNNIGCIYLRENLIPEAIEALSNACALERHPSGLNNLIIALSADEKFTEALENIRILRGLDTEILQKNHINLRQLNDAFITLLQKAGCGEEAQQRMLDMQKEALMKHRKKIEIIKSAVLHEGKKEEEKKQEASTKKRVNKTSRKPSTSELQSVSTIQDPLLLSAYVQEEKYKPIIPKEKVKTRGKATKKIEDNQEKEMMVAQEKSHVSIEELLEGENSTHYKVFSKFFEKYDSNTTDKHVQISMGEVSTLMEKLGQDFDKSSGKGSHTKLTLNFKDVGVDMNEKMIILSHKTYLLPYQIKALREAFLELGFYPRSLTEELRKKGEL